MEVCRWASSPQSRSARSRVNHLRHGGPCGVGFRVHCNQSSDAPGFQASSHEISSSSRRRGVSTIRRRTLSLASGYPRKCSDQASGIESRELTLRRMRRRGPWARVRSDADLNTGRRRDNAAGYRRLWIVAARLRRDDACCNGGRPCNTDIRRPVAGSSGQPAVDAGVVLLMAMRGRLRSHAAPRQPRNAFRLVHHDRHTQGQRNIRRHGTGNRQGCGWRAARGHVACGAGGAGDCRRCRRRVGPLRGNADGAAERRCAHLVVPRILKTGIRGPPHRSDDGRRCRRHDEILEQAVVYANGQYYLWYSGWRGELKPDTAISIGLATSPDGTHWTRHAQNPVITPGAPGSWNDLRVLAPDVVVLADGSLLMAAYGQAKKNIGREAGYIGFWSSR